MAKQYRITSENYRSKDYLWDAETEVLLALFVKRLVEIRPNLKWNVVTKEIIDNYIKKNPRAKVSATRIMRQLK